MGTASSFFRETFPAKPKWSTSEIPDLSGKVFFVTGGNAGIGKETTKVLLEHGARVYIACRSLDKAKAAAADLVQITGKPESSIGIVRLDLADFESIKGAVDDFLSKESRLDVLYNNGGIMRVPTDLVTKYGHDLQFGTNVLGHFYLTQLLLPTLIASAKTSPDGQARVVNLASSAHLLSPSVSAGGPIIIESLNDGPKRQSMHTADLYAQSKSGNLVFSNALARKYGNQGIVSISLNPGNINSDLWQHASLPVRLIMGPVLAPVPLGALTQLFAGTAPEAGKLNGKYLGPWARERVPRPDHLNVELEDKVWEWMEQQVKKHAP